MSTPPPPGAELEDALAALAPVSPRRPLRQAVTAATLSVTYAAVVLAVASVRRDLDGLPRRWLALYLAAWLVGFGLPLHVSLVPRAGSMLPRWRLGGALAAAAAVGFVAAGFLFRRHAAGSSQLGLHGSPACLSIGLVTAALPIALGTWMLRGAAPVGSRWTAAALGSAGGSLGGLVLHLHCPISDGLHVGVVHGGVVACAALLAAALVPSRLRP